MTAANSGTPCWRAWTSTPRAIPAKFLYDARGSALFDAICELPEYYLTRTETAILRRCAADIAAMAGSRLRAGRVRQRLEREVAAA